MFGGAISGGGGGSATPEWATLLSLHGASFAQAGTPVTSANSFDTGTGIFSFTFANTTVNSNGFRESDHYDIPILSIDPTFDPLTHLLEVEFEPTTRPVGGLDAAFQVGFISADSPENGVGLVYTNTAAAPTYVLHEQTTTGLGINAALTGVGSPGYAWYRFFAMDNDEEVRFAASYHNGTTWDLALTRDGLAYTARTAWYLRIGASKPSSANANGQIFAGKVRYKIVPLGAVPR